MKKFTRVFFIFFTLYTSLFGQNSFFNYFSQPLPNIIQPPLLALGKGDEISILGRINNENAIINLDENGFFNSAFRLKIDSVQSTWRINLFKKYNNYNFISFRMMPSSVLPNSGTGILMANFDSGKFWASKTSLGNNLFPLNFHLTLDNVIYSVNKNDSSEPSSIDLIKANILTGNRKWGHSFKKIGDNSFNYIVNDIIDIDRNQFVISFTRRFTDNLNNSKSEYGVLKLSEDGNILENIVFQDEHIEFFHPIEFSFQGVDKEQNIFIPGKITNFSGINGNDNEGVIIKLDSNLKVIWAKRLSAEKFNLEGLKLKVFPDGGVLWVYHTSGNLPVISGKLDKDGNLLWQKGYSFFLPQIEIDSNGAIYFLSNKRYFQDGTSEPATIIAKTNFDGNFETCSLFETCVTIHDISFSFTRWDWDKSIIPILKPLSFTFDTLNFTLFDNCSVPRPPTPFFHLPDTICQNQTLKPDSLYNHLAHATEWTITSQNTNLEFADTSWNYQFTEPGTYQIEQEIWLLGCSEFFTRTLVVLPDSLGNLLGDNRLICEDNPLSLSPTAVRPLRTFEWSDGSQNSSITISNSGIYAVTASDGFCSASDEVALTFFKDKYPNGIFELPTDSAVCVDLLPLSLMPTSELTDSFYLADSTIPQSVFELKTEGNYQISTEIENCRVEKNFELKITPCEIDIFFPNTFSPNDDGINDFAEPFGKEFDGLSLEIFNRWGGKVFESTAAPFAWDGNFDGKKANEGVYVFVFKYRNLRNGLEEMVSGDVLLMR